MKDIALFLLLVLSTGINIYLLLLLPGWRRVKKWWANRGQKQYDQGFADGFDYVAPSLIAVRAAFYALATLTQRQKLAGQLLREAVNKYPGKLSREDKKWFAGLWKPIGEELVRRRADNPQPKQKPQNGSGNGAQPVTEEPPAGASFYEGAYWG